MATRWQPSTCGCVIDFEREGDHHRITAIVPCKYHPDSANDVGKVLEKDLVHPHEQNVRANRAIAEALSRVPRLANETPSVRYEGKDGERVLTLSFETVTPGERAAIQKAVSPLGKTIIG